MRPTRCWCSSAARWPVLYARGRDIEDAETALRFDAASRRWTLLGTTDDLILSWLHRDPASRPRLVAADPGIARFRPHRPADVAAGLSPDRRCGRRAHRPRTRAGRTQFRACPTTGPRPGPQSLVTRR